MHVYVYAYTHTHTHIKEFAPVCQAVDARGKHGDDAIVKGLNLRLLVELVPGNRSRDKIFTRQNLCVKGLDLRLCLLRVGHV
jgi:hypothetical protein